MHQLLRVVCLGVILSCAMANQTISCPYADKPMHEIINELNKILEVCSVYHFEPESLEEVNNPPDEETARTTLRKFCNLTSSMEPCFTDATPEAEACLDQHQLLGYKVKQDNWRNGIHTVCSDIEERAAIALFREKSISHSKRATCEMALNVQFTAPVDPATSSLRFYRAIQTYKQCIMDAIGDKEENRVLSEAVSSLIMDILKVMKCVANDNETVQGCESLDNIVD